jgi:asparagine synthase (glutamine-hydrolysing)
MPASDSLLLARDRMGKKPLHYGIDAAGCLIFGSELKALMASGRLPDTVDLQAHHDYLALNYVPGDQTMFAAVRKLPPAHALLWKAGRVRTWRYWDVRFHSERPHRRPGRSRGGPQTLDLLRTAVRDRLVSDVPLGMFLSGGIDSSAVLMCMAEASPRPVEAFTIRFEEASYDESKQAARVAKQFGANHHVETVRPEAGTFLSPLVEVLDEPYADSSASPCGTCRGWRAGT